MSGDRGLSGASVMPGELPIFPLAGVLLLPGGRLPLHVFEPRYVNMVNDAMGRERLIGIVQPLAPGAASAAGSVGDDEPVYDTGCAGRITEFNETPDGRIMVTLTGVSRFRITGELALVSGYRRVSADWRAFAADLAGDGDLAGKAELMASLETFFSNKGVTVDWTEIDQWPGTTLVATLAMMCPFEAGEKQALLECDTWEDRADLLISLMEMAYHEGADISGPVRH